MASAKVATRVGEAIGESNEASKGASVGVSNGGSSTAEGGEVSVRAHGTGGEVGEVGVGGDGSEHLSAAVHSKVRLFHELCAGDADALSLTESAYVRAIDSFLADFSALALELRRLTRTYVAVEGYEGRVRQWLELLVELNAHLGDRQLLTASAEQHVLDISEQVAQDESKSQLDLRSSCALNESWGDDASLDGVPVSECSICVEERPLVPLECAHSFCAECVASHVMATIDIGRSLDVRCPHRECSELLSDQRLEEILSPESYARFQDVRSLSEMRLEKNFCWCPTKGCETAIVGDECDADFPKILCSECNERFCFHCRQAAHDGACGDTAPVDAHDEAFEQYVRDNNLVRCPECAVPVDHTSGCVLITCRCRCRFCIKCGERGRDDEHKSGYWWPTCKCTPGHVFYGYESVVTHWGKYPDARPPAPPADDESSLTASSYDAISESNEAPEATPVCDTFPSQQPSHDTFRPPSPPRANRLLMVATLTGRALLRPLNAVRRAIRPPPAGATPSSQNEDSQNEDTRPGW